MDATKEMEQEASPAVGDAFAVLPDHWHKAIAEYTTHRIGCPAEDGSSLEECECALHQFRATLFLALAKHLGAMPGHVAVEELRAKWRQEFMEVERALSQEYGCELLAPEERPCIACETSLRLRHRLLGPDPEPSHG